MVLGLGLEKGSIQESYMYLMAAAEYNVLT